MQHLILGYGYCGYFLAQELIKNGQQVTVVSRHQQQEYSLPVTHIQQDITHPLPLLEKDTCIYYLIPPPADGDSDKLVQQFLQHNSNTFKKVIYFGSSGVYGAHQGALVDEEDECRIQHSRQLRRLDAEQQWHTYCTQNNIALTLLRIGGIFGPNRLPITAAQQQQPLIYRQFAPLINHIYVRDLARIAFILANSNDNYRLLNVADGRPLAMGTVQSRIAKMLKIPPAPYQSWEDAWSTASPMKKEFLHGSKKLNINRLLAQLPASFAFTPLDTALKDSL